MRRSLQILLALLMFAFVLAVAAGCGDDDEPSNEPDTVQQPDNSASGDEADPIAAAGIDPTSGAFQGLKPDTREGTPPPSAPDSLEQAAQQAGCTLRLDLRDETRGLSIEEIHLRPGEEGHPRYGTNPPTSGIHDQVPAADGAYRETPPDINVVHSLEHGRVAIQYAPSVPSGQQLALKGVFNADPDGMLMFPNNAMPYDVAVTAWTNLMGCNEPSDADALAAAVLAFRDEFRGQGPEPVPL